MKYYLASQICKAFDIPPRTHQHWLDRGFIAADLRDRQPREYSLRQALYTGLIHHFIQRGWTLERAHRLARYSGAAWLSCMKMLKDLQAKPDVTLRIYNNVWIAIEAILKNSDGDEVMTIYWTAPTTNEGITGREADFLNGQIDEAYSLNLNAILPHFMDSLGADHEEIQALPDDPGLYVVEGKIQGDPANQKLFIIREKA